jgi:hypothetical protein
MSLQKSRDADSIPGAVAKVIATLGNGDIPAGLIEAEALTGRKAWTIREWLDPDKASEPGVSSALALDAAYARATGMEGPIWRVYGELLSRATNGTAGADRLDLLRETVSVQIAAADVSRAIRDATHPDSPGGVAIAPCEVARISHAADALADANSRVLIAARQTMKDPR